MKLEFRQCVHFAETAGAKRSDHRHGAGTERTSSGTAAAYRTVSNRAQQPHLLVPFCREGGQVFLRAPLGPWLLRRVPFGRFQGQSGHQPAIA